jgi:hypothetical protein
MLLVDAVANSRGTEIGANFNGIHVRAQLMWRVEPRDEEAVYRLRRIRHRDVYHANAPAVAAKTAP